VRLGVRASGNHERKCNRLNTNAPNLSSKVGMWLMQETRNAYSRLISSVDGQVLCS